MRAALLLTLALGINFGLFASMGRMVAGERASRSERRQVRTIDFIRAPLPESTAEKDRRRRAPPKPETLRRPRVRAPDLELPAQSAPLPIEALAFEVQSLIRAGAAGGVALSTTLADGSGGAAEIETLLESQLRPISRLPARYPPGAEMRGLEGSVTLSYRVTEDGTVEDIQVVDSNPRGVFDRAAEQAARRWRYQPVIRGGRPTSVRTFTRIRFELPDR